MFNRNLGEFLYMNNEFQKEEIAAALIRAYTRGEDIEQASVQHRAAASVNCNLDDFSNKDLEDIKRLVLKKILH